MISKLKYKLYKQLFPSIPDVFNLLGNAYGYHRTLEVMESVDVQGRPIPWYTYPALEYIKQIDFSDATVFEWGSGNSSLYWAKVAKSVTSIEDNLEWFQKVKMHQLPNLAIRLIEEQQKYITAVEEDGLKYDLIVIDGSYRYQCAQIAPRYLKEGGLVILDNSDWCPESAKILRNADLIEVDMSGIGPVCGYTWTTSLFFQRSYRRVSIQSNQPSPSIASINAPQDEKLRLR